MAERRARIVHGPCNVAVHRPWPSVVPVHRHGPCVVPASFMARIVPVYRPCIVYGRKAVVRRPASFLAERRPASCPCVRAFVPAPWRRSWSRSPRARASFIGVAVHGSWSRHSCVVPGIVRPQVRARASFMARALWPCTWPERRARASFMARIVRVSCCLAAERRSCARASYRPVHRSWFKGRVPVHRSWPVHCARGSCRASFMAERRSCVARIVRAVRRPSWASFVARASSLMAEHRARIAPCASPGGRAPRLRFASRSRLARIVPMHRLWPKGRVLHRARDRSWPSIAPASLVGPRPMHRSRVEGRPASSVGGSLMAEGRACIAHGSPRPMAGRCAPAHGPMDRCIACSWPWPRVAPASARIAHGRASRLHRGPSAWTGPMLVDSGKGSLAVPKSLSRLSPSGMTPLPSPFDHAELSAKPDGSCLATP
ncbi:hypothetical protein NL676_007043 [Syzygium grande]|nr:hypothetical protein NL676_007043 [Syzygium grande]